MIEEATEEQKRSRSIDLMYQMTAASFEECNIRCNDQEATLPINTIEDSTFDKLRRPINPNVRYSHRTAITVKAARIESKDVTFDTDGAGVENHASVRSIITLNGSPSSKTIQFNNFFFCFQLGTNSVVNTFYGRNERVHDFIGHNDEEQILGHIAALTNLMFVDI